MFPEDCGPICVVCIVLNNYLVGRLYLGLCLQSRPKRVVGIANLFVWAIIGARGMLLLKKKETPPEITPDTSDSSVPLWRSVTAPPTRTTSLKGALDRRGAPVGQTDGKPRKEARTQRPATTLGLGQGRPRPQSVGHLRAIAYPAQKRLPGQGRDVMHPQSTFGLALERPATAKIPNSDMLPVVFPSGRMRMAFVVGLGIQTVAHSS